MKVINRIIEYGIYLLIIILPFQTRLMLSSGEDRLGFLEYERISLYASDILIVALLILWLIVFLKGPKKVKELPIYWWIIAGLDLVIFISIFYAPDKALAFYHYLLFIEGIGLFFLILNAKYNKLFFYLFLAISLLIQSVLSIFQFLSQGSPASKWLGMASHFPADLGASVIDTFGADGIGERWLRAYGSFDHPNILGAFLVIGILLLLYLMLKGRVKPKTAELNLCLVASVVSILALVFSFSRSSWLALLFGVLLLLIYFAFLRNKLAQIKILTFIFISSLIIAAPFFTYNNLFVTRISGEGRLEEKSINERTKYSMEESLLIRDKIFTGAGIGNYIGVQTEKRPSDPFWAFEPVHNTFLLILSEIGIVGLLMFLAMISYLAVESFARKNIVNLSILASLVIMMLLDHFWWSLHFGILFFWLIMALLIKNLKDKKI